MQQGQSGQDQFRVVLFGLKRAFFGAGEGGWVEDNHFKKLLLLRQPPQPVENVAKNELVLGEWKLVGSEVSFSPFKIFPGQIDVNGPGAGFGRGYREAARVGEGVQDGCAGGGLHKERKTGRDVTGQQPAAVVPLIEKQTH